MKKPPAIFTVAILLGLVLLCAVPVAAEWRIDIESKTVEAGQTDVTLDFTVHWDIAMLSLTIPVVVRDIDPGAFWTGMLPYDTGGNGFSHPYVQGISWNWEEPWAAIIEEVRPGPFADSSGLCEHDLDNLYNGVPPDNFIVNAFGAATAVAPEPNGRPVLTLTFDVNFATGRFEFDTACFTSILHTISMIDYSMPPVDHGPNGTNEVTFNKGVITIESAGAILETTDVVPREFVLAQNHPNPFNASTRIEFSLPEPGLINLDVYDILGRYVTTLLEGFVPAGIQQTTWDGTDHRGDDVGSGVYFYRLTTDDHSELKKMLLLK